MKRRLSPISRVKQVAVAVGVTSLLAVTVNPALASSFGSAKTSSRVTTIYIKGSSTNSLRFVGPKTIKEGGELRIVNQTNPHQVGPQTFSLVEASELPKTLNERSSCHICKAIKGWQGIGGSGSAKVNPVEAGAEGWSTMGTSSKKGDSWFTGTKPNGSFQQSVDAEASAGPFLLTFMSAFDPALQGQITVIPVE